jgi:transcription initiation factor IIE alpha subunit
MLTCPYCHAKTSGSIPVLFDWIDVGRFTCEHCKRPLVVIDNVPMTEETD